MVEIDGHKVSRQAELKHLLGPHYSGDKVQLAVMRGNQRIEATVELTDKLAAYAHPFLGMLPIRPAVEAAGNPGVAVRYVYPDSPAAKAGLKPADRITEWQDKPVKNYGELRGSTCRARPARQSQVHRASWRRNAALRRAARDVARSDSCRSAAGARCAVGATLIRSWPLRVVPIKLPDAKNKALAYVPENYNPAVACGVVIWLYPPGLTKRRNF